MSSCMKAMNSLGHGEDRIKNRRKSREWKSDGIAVEGRFMTSLFMLEKSGRYLMSQISDCSNVVLE